MDTTFQSDVGAAPAELPPSRITPTQSRTLVAQLRRSDVFRDYERAFRDTTGLPIALRPLEAFDLPHHGDPKESRFCALMTKSNHSCSACLQAQREVEQGAQHTATTRQCFAGLCDSAVPVRVGQKLVAFLQTGQIMARAPRKAEFARAVRELQRLGAELDFAELETAYFQTRVIPTKQYESIVRLLSIFAQHLAALSNQLMVQGAATEAPTIARVKGFIAERYTEQLSLPEVARSVNMSTFYLCKSFKKATGMTFTEYLARFRVERVKELLLNPHKRVSEAAYEAGFQSLSQFNRVFHRVAGEPPSVYRARVHGGLVADRAGA